MNNKKARSLSSLVGGLLDKMSAAELMSAMLSGQISAAITVAREDRKMTQAQFAELMGVKQAQVSKWENGGCNFSIGKLCEIATKLGMEFHCSLKEPAKQEPAVTYDKYNTKIIGIFDSSKCWKEASSEANKWMIEEALEEM